MSGGAAATGEAGCLRGEQDHGHMAAILALDQEDAGRPNRERENLVGQ
jgi:transposase